MKLRLQPIRVYCMHHVCATFEPESMYAEDWMQIDNFKLTITNMRREGYVFISMTEAYRKIKIDKWRKRKYAVLTFDDGYASLKEILPWLEMQQIPAALFINGKYLDGKSYRENKKEQYLTYRELFALTSPLIEIGSHGWEHGEVLLMSETEFKASVLKNIQLLSSHPRYIPFFAYAYGRYNKMTNDVLQELGLLPVFVSGNTNYNNTQYIDRMVIDGLTNERMNELMN